MPINQYNTHLASIMHGPSAIVDLALAFTSSSSLVLGVTTRVMSAFSALSATATITFAATAITFAAAAITFAPWHRVGRVVRRLYPIRSRVRGCVRGRVWSCPIRGRVWSCPIRSGVWGCVWGRVWSRGGGRTWWTRWARPRRTRRL